MEDPEELQKSARILLLAQYGTPEQIAAVDKLLPQSKKKVEQVKTEGLEGYTFDPATGSFSINPEIKQVLEDKAAAAAAKGDAD